jgi:hypothetical protein
MEASARLLATLVVVVHLAFVAFVVAGGVLALRWPRVVWLHLPAAAWGALITFAGIVCPLTPLENWLRVRGGGSGYDTGFLEHYLLPVLYPVAMTRGLQVATGVFVIAVNVLVYWRVFRRRRKLAGTRMAPPVNGLHGEVNHVQDPDAR